MPKTVKKICLIGPEGVGKTSMIRRYVDNSFDEKYITTIGVSLSHKIISIDDGQKLEIILWDLEGFTSKGLHFPESYLNGASGFIFVSDITKPETLLSTQKVCLNLYDKFEDKRCFSLALNKTDLVKESNDFIRHEATARELFKDCHPTNVMCTSAKSDHNVSDLFKDLGTKLIKFNVPNFKSY